MRYVCPECGEPGEAGRCPRDGVARAAAGTDPLLGTTIGSWRVARVLGAGGMGRVYAAVQPAIGARVAIKVLRRESGGEDLVERFFNEARAVNLIRHDNIVQILDLARLPDGAPYIVMEYLEGASLRGVFRRHRTVPLGTLADLVGEVLAALEAAHAKGIVHRDLKPDNVFVSPTGRVTVLDFGIAKLERAEGMVSTQTGSLLGTPAYMSPEQARSQPVDPRADLYATGIMLYEGATGTLPFSADNLFDLLQLHVAAAPEAPRRRNPEMPSALEAVILRALEKDPDRRFSSAAEMARALAGAANGLPRIARDALVAPAAAPPEAVADPHGATAASTDASLARGETVASAPSPAPRDAATPRPARRRTALLVAGGAALAAGGAVTALLVAGGSRHVETTPSVAHADLPADAAAPAPPSPPDAHDAGVALADGPPAPTPVRETAPEPPSPRAPVVRAPSPPAPDDTVPHPVPRPRAFDPARYYATARARAQRVAHAKVVPLSIRWHGLDHTGHIDTTAAHHSAEYEFGVPASPTGECYVQVEVKDGMATVTPGHPAEGSSCPRFGIDPPGCSGAELWARATAKGLPPDTEVVSAAHQYRGGWVVSTGELSVDLDCP